MYLLKIDQEVSRGKFSPAEYEIVRRMIYVSGDFDYHSLVNFTSNALLSGAAALSARVPIIVDTPIIQVGITSLLQATFLNPVYCIEEIPVSAFFEQKVSLILQSFANRYPSAIYLFGQNQIMLASLLDFIQSKQIQPSLIIATPSGFIHNLLPITYYLLPINLVLSKARFVRIPPVRHFLGESP